MTAARRTRLVVLGVSLAAVLALIGWAVFRLRVHQACSHDPIEGVTSFGLVSASVFGFVGGHLLGRWLEATSPPRDPDRKSPAGGMILSRLDSAAADRRAKLVVQAMLVLFLALAVGLLVYEALALADTGANWPITYYVRCFAHTKAWAAGFGALAISSLLGQWVWYPAR